MIGNLLKTPGAAAKEDLNLALAAIKRAFPLKAAHRKTLPYAIRDLSRMLTSERGQIQGYWQKPPLTGAYLYYFLPWNLFRLSWLLPALRIDLAPESRILDLGSGPLTLPLGLWLARPDLRAVPLHITCADPAQRPMELGKAVLEELGGAENPWQINLVRAPIDMALRKSGRVNLIMAGNVLNEISSRQETLEERLENIFYSMDRCLEPGGRIFIMEPGTRLGGKLISMLRRIALEEGYTVEAPCTHAEGCPYAPPPEDPEQDKAAQKKRSVARQPSGWCHFNLTSNGAPDELAALSREADLEKERLSFACLLLRKAEPSAKPHEKRVPGGLITPVRVISDLIRIPGSPGARYVCSSQGLALLSGAERLQSGMISEAFLADKAGRDAKSGAWIMSPAEHPAQSKQSARPRRSAQPERPASPRPAAEQKKPRNPKGSRGSKKR